MMLSLLSDAIMNGVPTVYNKVTIMILKTDDFIAISFWSDGKNAVFSFLCRCYFIIYRAIFEDIMLLCMMSMTIKTEHKSWIKLHIMIERLCHIVVELLAIRRCVHTDNGPIK